MIGLFIVASGIESKEKLEKRIHGRIAHILENMDNSYILEFLNDPDEAEKTLKIHSPKISGSIILVASGGSEELIEIIVETVPKPVLLWANGEKNSFASSLEAYSVMKKKFPIKILYSSLESKDIVADIKRFIKVCETIEELENSIVGCVGKPSTWLLTSRGINSFGNFKTQLLNIKIDELVKLVEKTDDMDTQELYESIKQTAKNIKVYNTDLIYSIKVYLAMKKLIEQHDLDAITIRCFDLLQFNYTACLGMSLCNDEGITSGCEGDLQATFSMMIATLLTGHPCWMANPSRIDMVKNTITLAHCTVPLKMLTQSPTLTSHMESDLSTAIQAPLEKRTVTLLRIGGNFDQMIIATGKIIRTGMEDETLCRTQAEIELSGNISDWIENCPGNHQVLIYGDIKELLMDFCRFKNIKYTLV